MIGELVVAADTVMIAKVGATGPDWSLVAPGVVATGDLFHIDDDGYLHFKGRLSDFIVVRGEKVSLHAVRQYVQSLPGVIRCATTVDDDSSDATAFDLSVELADADEDGTSGRRIRQALGAFLLPGERPRAVTVQPTDLAVFQK